MKELSIEEKAKRYDEAIEELRGLLEGIHEEKCEILEEDIIDIFPELKESEDEKIRKEIIDAFKTLGDGKIPVVINYADIFTWLEKQKEQNSANKVELSTFRDNLLMLFQKFRWYCKDEIPTNGDIIDYVDAHIHELYNI